MVGFWATVALNIPDFTRYAKSQKAQMLGQALGLPTAMTLYSFIGVAVTSASVVLFGEAIWDPVALLGRFNQPVVAFIALIALLIATLNTNVAANVVSPSNDFSNLNPRLISFRTGGLITGVIGVLMMPWKLLTRFQRLHFRLAGGLLGTARADRRRDDRGLFRGAALASARWTICTAATASTNTITASTGAPSSRWRRESPWRCWDWWSRRCGCLYDYAWFVGFGVSGAVYVLLMQRAAAPANDSGMGG